MHAIKLRLKVEEVMKVNIKKVPHFFLNKFFFDFSGDICRDCSTSFSGLAGIETIFAEDFFLFFRRPSPGLFFSFIFLSFDKFLGVNVEKKGLTTPKFEFLALLEAR